MFLNFVTKVWALESVLFFSFLLGSNMNAIAGQSSTIEYECDGSNLVDTIPLFGQQLLVSGNFKRDPKNTNSFIDERSTVSIYGTSSKYDFFRLRYGEVSSNYFEGWKKVEIDDAITYTIIGVEIREQRTDHSNGVIGYQLVFLWQDEYLHIISFAPVSWRSVLQCFR